MRNKISLIIPLKDEEGTVSRLLDSVLKQARIPDEIVITDAGSTDGTVDIVNRYIKKGMNIKIIGTKDAYPGKARNLAIEAASFDIIAMTDGGIRLDDGWLKELENTLEEETGIDVVYGSYRPLCDSLFKEALSFAFVAPSKFINGKRARDHFIASSLIRKDVWKSIGGFPDTRAGEDRVFMENIEKNDFKIRYNPDAYVTWDIPKDLKSVFMRFSNYSYHDLRAARYKDWHLPVLKMYTMAILFLVLGIWLSPVFLLLPVLGFASRIIKKLYINKNEPYFKAKSIPLYFALTGFLIFFIDMAMFAGWIKYIIYEK